MEDLFEKAPGITSPWFIESIKFDAESSRLDITINFKKGSTFLDGDEDDTEGKTENTRLTTQFR